MTALTGVEVYDAYAAAWFRLPSMDVARGLAPLVCLSSCDSEFQPADLPEPAPAPEPEPEPEPEPAMPCYEVMTYSAPGAELTLQAVGDRCVTTGSSSVCLRATPLPRTAMFTQKCIGLASQNVWMCMRDSSTLYPRGTRQNPCPSTGVSGTSTSTSTDTIQRLCVFLCLSSIAPPVLGAGRLCAFALFCHVFLDAHPAPRQGS